MGKVFVGTGYNEPPRYGVQIEEAGGWYSFKHKVDGDFVDFEWDGGGPGTTDLARALLSEVTGMEPEWRTYRLFKTEVVATWPRHVGECWRMSEEEIRQWLAGVEQDEARTETAVQTQARLGQMRDRDERVKGFGRLFRR